MIPLRRRRLTVLLTGLALLVVHPTPSSAHDDAPGRAARGEAAGVVHRVVWDAYHPGRRGIHLRSADPDGTDRRRTYDLDVGFTLYLSQSPDGRDVAFATCCRTTMPPMVVVPVDGGTPVHPLAHHPRIDFVGGIGWSPDGRRLAFEGTGGSYPNRRTSLWTIRPDGTGLRRVLDLGRLDDSFFINDALAWTRAGILYSDGRNLRSAKGGESHLVMRRVTSVRISGDGQHIVTSRPRANGGAYWIGNPDGTDQHRLLSNGEEGVTTTYSDLIPNYDGSALLAHRSVPGEQEGDPGRGDVVTWQVADGPATATVVDVVDGSYAVSWNRQRTRQLSR